MGCVMCGCAQRRSDLMSAARSIVTGHYAQAAGDLVRVAQSASQDLRAVASSAARMRLMVRR
jgi:hypothetical protein